MKKIAIITKYSAYNYGAMLQAYALQTTIEKLGATPIMVDFEKQERPNFKVGKSIIGLINKIYSIRYKNELANGFKRFEQFRDESLYLSNSYNSYAELKENPPEADVYISGSDQVWNPLKIQETSFLRFLPKDKVKASYAASMGISYIPKGSMRLFAEYVSDFDFISVREEDAKKLIEESTEEKCRVDVDPVFLLSKDEWKELAVPSQIKKPYILCYCLYRPQWLNDWLKKLNKATGKDIVVVTINAYRNLYHNKIVRDAGPREMLGLLINAGFVISSSFHGVALSIVNRKPFYAIINPDAPSRIENMLKRFHLENRTLSPEHLPVLDEINYSKAEIAIEQHTNDSYNYIEFLILSAEKRDKNCTSHNNPIKYKNVEEIGSNCTGCTVCKYVCPTNAISFIGDEYGFKYPKVNKYKCISCGKCLKKCHTLERVGNSKESCEAYYGWCKNDSVRNLSSSGGFFSVIAEYVLERKGLVIGAYFDAKTKKVIHKSSDDISWELFRRSKYVESDMDNILSTINQALEQERCVLFCGTPCQCAGIRMVFGNNDNLILCDFLCHGVPSSKFFEEFLLHKEKCLNDSITNYEFRTKTFGWNQHGLRTTLSSGRELETVGRCESYFIATMMDDLFLRECCYTCDKAMYHTSDFTIGDFWGIVNISETEYDNKGISIIFENTSLSKKLMDGIKNKMVLYPVAIDDIRYAFNVKNKEHLIKKRNSEFDEFNSNGYTEYIKKHYQRKMIRNKLIFSVQKMLAKIMKKSYVSTIVKRT